MRNALNRPAWLNELRPRKEPFSEALESLRSATDLMSAGLDAHIVASEGSLTQLKEELKFS